MWPKFLRRHTYIHDSTRCLCMYKAKTDTLYHHRNWSFNIANSECGKCVTVHVASESVGSLRLSYHETHGTKGKKFNFFMSLFLCPTIILPSSSASNQRKRVSLEFHSVSTQKNEVGPMINGSKFSFLLEYTYTWTKRRTLELESSIFFSLFRLDCK